MTESAVATPPQTIAELIEEYLADQTVDIKTKVSRFVAQATSASVAPRLRRNAMRRTPEHSRELQGLISAARSLYDESSNLNNWLSRDSEGNTRIVTAPVAFLEQFPPQLLRIREILTSSLAFYGQEDAQQSSFDATLVRELGLLLRRGATFTQDGLMVALKTTDCVLRRNMESPEINFGPFEIRLRAVELASLRQGDGSTEEYFKAIPLRLCSTASEERAHPHVANGKMCLGDGRQRAGALFKAGYVDEAFVIIDTVLHTLGASPFFSIETFYTPEQRPTRCVDCGASISLRGDDDDDDDDYDETYHVCATGGYLCGNCGHEHSRSGGWHRGVGFECSSCHGTFPASERQVITATSAVVCEHCAVMQDQPYTAFVVGRAPPAPPRAPPPVPTFVCGACGSAGATTHITDTTLGTVGCEHCSTSIERDQVSNSVFSSSGMFAGWVLTHLQRSLGNDRAYHMNLRANPGSYDGRLAIVRRLLSQDTRAWYMSVNRVRGPGASLRSIMTALNNRAGVELVGASQESCDYYDAEHAEIILSSPQT